MIKLQNISKKFGDKTIFNNLNLEIADGEAVALVGPSGSGKTTILNIIGLIDDFDNGNYYLNFASEGNNMKNAPKANSKDSVKIIRKYINYLFQNFALVDDETVWQNLVMALEYSKVDRKQVIADALEKVGLVGYENKKIFELSGGEQQRIAIARAMIKPAELILADEPTGSLDLENRDKILELLDGLVKNGKTLIVVTHDLNVANHFDRVIDITDFQK
jgi:putative ABC transport system ATP-binding protein